jgi:hypothetical protein
MNPLVRLFIILPFALSITACTSKNAIVNEYPATSNLSTTLGMAEYLKDLPAVKNVNKWYNDYAPGIIITTRHYNIHTTLLEPLMLRQLPPFLEAAYSEYQSQLPKPVETKTKFTVYLFAQRNQWEQFTKDFTPNNAHVYLKIKKGAYYLNDACVAYNIGRTRTFAVLGHEGWHHFNSKHFIFRLPSWLDEGIATLFETASYHKGKFYFQPEKNAGRLGALKKTLAANKSFPLRDLIALNPANVINDPQASLAFYAQSYALIRFLREDDYGKRLRKYQNLLLAAHRGNWPLEPSIKKIAADRNTPLTTNFNTAVSSKLFSLYIEDDLEKIETEYENFCKKIVYYVRLKN